MKIVSGGQDGVDTISLQAAKDAGMKTGGTMAKGFMTISGPNPERAETFGLVECDTPGYPARTRANVRETDGTVIIYDEYSPGYARTLKEVKIAGKDVLCIKLPITIANRAKNKKEIINFLKRHSVVNFAGNRKIRGEDILYDFLLGIFKGIVKEEGNW